RGFLGAEARPRPVCGQAGCAVARSGLARGCRVYPMSTPRYILALDQGTTSSRAMVFDRAGGVVGSAQKEFRQIYPRPGWVEHDPLEIWSSQNATAAEALSKANLDTSE